MALGAAGAAQAQTPAEKATYLQQRPDVAKAGVDAWDHYRNVGYKEKMSWPRDGSEAEPPQSEKNEYYRMRPDVAKAGMDAWDHYRAWGKKEGMKWPSTPKEPVSQPKSVNQHTPTEPAISQTNAIDQSVMRSNLEKAEKRDFAIASTHTTTHTREPNARQMSAATVKERFIRSMNTKQMEMLTFMKNVAIEAYSNREMWDTSRARAIKTLELRFNGNSSMINFVVPMAIDPVYSVPKGRLTQEEILKKVTDEFVIAAMSNPSFNDVK